MKEFFSEVCSGLSLAQSTAFAAAAWIIFAWRAGLLPQ